jgi:threonine dehydrogenase-like Zn-dependent dehydrogenase
VEAVGMEAHATGIVEAYDRTKQTLRMEQDRPHALRQSIQACRKAGTVSVPGVFSGLIDKFNFGSAFSKGLSLKMGQTHVQKYMGPLLAKVEKGELDATFLITHRMPLADAPKGYDLFETKQDDCIKVVMSP